MFVLQKLLLLFLEGVVQLECNYMLTNKYFIYFVWPVGLNKIKEKSAAGCLIYEDLWCDS